MSHGCGARLPSRSEILEALLPQMHEKLSKTQQKYSKMQHTSRLARLRRSLIGTTYPSGSLRIPSQSIDDGSGTIVSCSRRCLTPPQLRFIGCNPSGIAAAMISRR